MPLKGTADLFCNLTDKQKELARFLVEQTEKGNLPESFHVFGNLGRDRIFLSGDSR
jgi:hypothetical protein